MIIKKITSDSWHEFKNIRLEALKTEPQAFGDNYDFLLKKDDIYWQKNLNNKWQVWYGVYDTDLLVGIGSIKFARAIKFNHIAHLSGIFVKNDWRGKGIGKLLFKTRIDQAFERSGIVKLKLIVNKSQINAIGLYQSFGFQIVGDLKKEFKLENSYFDAYLMELLK